MTYQLENNKIDIRYPEESKKGYVNNTKRFHEFNFNGIFDKDVSQEEIFEHIGTKVIKK